MTIKSTLKVCLASTMLLASQAFAEPLTWQYIDFRYLQPSDTDTRGLSGEVSGHITTNWLLQGRVSRLELEEKDLDLEMSQTRYDLMVGRVFPFGEKYAAFLSAGYTHLDYATNIGTLDEDESTDAANVQALMRARFTKRFEAEGGLGILIDDKDTSDLVWNVGLRFWATDSISLMIGANGIDSEDFADDILYEIGFRYDLR